MKKNKIVIILVILLLLPSFVSSEEFKLNNDKVVYFLVLNKLSLEDINNMPKLKELSNNYSLGLMNTRGSNGYTGAESFATINSSSKTYANDISSEFKETNEGNIVNTTTGRIYNLNDNNRYSPDIGILGDKLKDNGIKTGVFGNSNIIENDITYSALIPMNSEGIVDDGKITDMNIMKDGYPYNISTDYNKILTLVKESKVNFKVIDLGDLERLFRYSNNYTDEEYFDKRKQILTDLDNFIAELYDILYDKNSMIIITSPNAPDTKITTNRLAPLAIISNSSENAGITSNTTKRKHLVGNIDLAPTILDFFDIEIEELSGNRINFNQSMKSSYGKLLKESNRINTTSRIRYRSLLYYSIFSIIILLFIGIVTLGRFRLSYNINNLINSLLSLIFSIPIIFIFLSILRLDNIYMYIGIMLGLIITAFILEYKYKLISKNIGVLAFCNILIIIMDLLLKGSITRYSILSHDPVIGARYYGIGNELVGLLLGSIAIFMSNIKNENNFINLVNLIIMSMGVLLVGHPKIGANLGGTLALFMVLVFYIIEKKDIEISIRKILYLSFLLVGIFFIIGFIDIKFNPSTTHLGNTVLLIVNGGILNFIQIIFRKLLMNIKLIGSSFWTYVLLINLISFIILIYREGKIKDNKLIATMVVTMGALVGFIVNDSGLILAAICMNLIVTDYYLVGSDKFEKKQIG